MPELPEMENYRLHLEQKITGREIIRVEVNRAKTVNIPAGDFISKVQGAIIADISRKGKNLFFHLDNGLYLHLHLMLGGWMYYSPPQNSPQRTKQVILGFADGMELYFINLRLGFLHLLTAQEWQAELSTLGPDIFSPEFNQAFFRELLSGKRGYLKPVLVNQKLLSGLGNAYSDEICFTAGLRPDQKIDSISEEQAAKLYDHMRPVLTRALQFGGYMDHPFFPGDELTGGYNQSFYVYDRAGELCPSCTGTILQGEVTGRKFFYCPNCQP